MRFPLTFSLLAANIVLFLVQIVFPVVTDVLSLTPAQAFGGSYWQFITYMFMHGGFIHIFFNMFVLFTFGMPVEGTLGAKKFGALYFVSGIGSALLYIAIALLAMPSDLNVMMLGASGAIFGILTAYGFLFPRNMIWIPPGIPLPARFAVIAFVVLELFLGITGLEPGVANFGHLGGIAAGALLMLWWRRRENTRHSGFKNFEFVWE